MKDKDLEKTIKNLRKLTIRVQKNVVNGATRAAAASIQKEAKAQAPVGDTGILKRSIQVRRMRSYKKGITRFKIGARYGRSAGKVDAWYAHFIEYGTRTIPANPFMRRAFYSKGEQSVGIAREYMRKRVPLEIAKLKVT